jgi:mRNA interferase HicA
VVGRNVSCQDPTPRFLHEIDKRTFSSDNAAVTGNEFLRKLRVLGKRRGIPVSLNATRGKGSHQTVYFGGAFTVLRSPKDELKTGTLHAICSQLGIKVADL